MMQEFKGHALAMPLSNKADGSGFVSSYGNSIAIPAPGIDQPTPAWTSSPGGLSLPRDFSGISLNIRTAAKARA